jgi:hypothetical protein
MVSGSSCTNIISFLLRPRATPLTPHVESAKRFEITRMATVVDIAYFSRASNFLTLHALLIRDLAAFPGFEFFDNLLARFSTLFSATVFSHEKLPAFFTSP